MISNKTLKKTVVLKSRKDYTYVFNLVKTSGSSGYSVQNAITRFWHSIIVKDEKELIQHFRNKGWNV